ncbi:MAG: hypothetical protein PHF17_11830 [Arcobacteraceae bacterium]|nr:hypothetical protein [Arcobacteraceae bacterium]
MSRYKISEEELNDIFNTSALYTKGLDYHQQKTLNDYKGQLQVDVKDYGDVIIIKKQFRSFNDLEIDFFGDGSYLSCFYSKSYSGSIFHLSP